MRTATKLITCFFLLVVSGQTVFATEDLAKQSQNPLGTIISAPFENNFNFGIGPSDATAYVLNMKPVYPVMVSAVKPFVHLQQICRN